MRDTSPVPAAPASLQGQRPLPLPAMSTRAEFFCVLAITLAVLAINFLTGERSPTVWLDEAMFCDAPANFYFGRPFTSGGWRQPADEIWSANAPLYTWLLTPWIQLTGFSPLAVRSLGYVCIALAGLLLWVAVRRAGLITSPRLRLVLVAAAFCQATVSFNYRGGRYDSLAMLVLAAAMLAATIASPRLRAAALFACGALLPLTMLPLVPFALVVSALAVLFLGRAVIAYAAPVLAGIPAGFAIMWAGFELTGAHGGLRRLLSIHSYSLPERLTSMLGDPLVLLHGYGAGFRPHDPGLLLMFAAAVVLIVAARPWRRVEWLLLAITVVVPPAIGFAGQFPTYYAWMCALPLLLLLLMRLEHLISYGRKALALSVAGVLLAMALLGLPARTVVAVREWQLRDYAPVEAAVRRHLKPDDHVLANEQAFYAARPIVPYLYTRTHWPVMSAREAAGVTVLVIADFDQPEAMRALSSRMEEWTEIGAVSNVTQATTARQYNLRLFRRIAPASTARGAHD